MRGALVVGRTVGEAFNWTHRLELACNIGTDEQYAQLRELAPVMLEEWSRTKRAPRHAEWLHREPAGDGDRA